MTYLEDWEFNTNDNKFGLTECVACLEKYTDGQILSVTPCSHNVHQECCLNWLMSRNQEKEQRCPMCNIVMDITILKKNKEKQNN